MSPFCVVNYKRKGPGQAQPPLPADIQVWRVPVGTFTPYVRCGVTVTNVEDPYDTQAAPKDWPRLHRVLLNANWDTVQSGGSCMRASAAATSTADSGKVGTYWTCESNQTENGTAIDGEPPPSGGLTSPFCVANYGRPGPGQQQPPLPADIEVWRVPVGTFTPYVHCGVRVMNIEDPYDPRTAPGYLAPRPQVALGRQLEPD